MKVFVYVIVLLCSMLASQSFGQNKEVSTTDAWGPNKTAIADTLWLVNFQYAYDKCDTLAVKLNFPNDSRVTGYTQVKIDWYGDDSETATATIGGVPAKHIYRAFKETVPKDMSCRIKLTLTGNGLPDKIIHRDVFNRMLLGRAVIDTDYGIEKRKYPIDGCMEDGIDTIFVRMEGIAGNPPGTTYEAKVDGAEVVHCSAKQDSAFVIFKEPNGGIDDKGIQVEYFIQYFPVKANKQNKMTNWATAQTDEGQSKVHVYAAPDLKNIFNFKDSITEGATPADLIMQVCSGQAPEFLSYQDAVAQKYYYKSTGEPSYRDFSVDYKVQYFKKDSFEQLEWKLLPEKNADVDSTREEGKDMSFYSSGLYKIRIESRNACGGDTIWTDTVPNIPMGDSDPSKWIRYIQVAQSGEGNMVSFRDTSCLRGTSKTDTLTFVDRGKRIKMDFYPNYNFEINKLMKASSGLDSIVSYKLDQKGSGSKVADFFDQKAYLNGIVIDKTENQATDSIVMKLVFKEIGKYQIILNRGGGKCDTAKYIDTLLVGARPEFGNRNLLRGVFGSAPQTGKGDTIDLCGKYTYTVPEDWKKDLTYNNMKSDSVAWLFRKGTLEQKTLPKNKTFEFDSVGDVYNRVRVIAHNYCGEDTLKVDFYTRIQPKIDLWRDSVPDNDSLCVNFTYDYFFKGTLPEFYTIKATFDQPIDSAGVPKKSMTVRNDSVIRELKYTQNKEVNETYVVTNDKNEKCVQTSGLKNVFILQPDSLMFRDSILHCAAFTTFKGQKLFDPTKPVNYKKLEWSWGTVHSSDNNPDISLKNNANDTLRIKISNSKGCYVRQRLVFIPKKMPTFEIKSGTGVHQDGKLYDIHRCAIDSVKYLDLVTTNVGKADSVAVTVFSQTNTNKEMLYGRNGNTIINKKLDITKTSPDKFFIRYELANTKVTPGFGDCTLTDSIRVDVSKPKLNITQMDTLRDKNLITYDFVTAKGKIDTAQVTIGTGMWKVLTSATGTLSTGETDMYAVKYTLSQTDRQLDTLKFELTAKSSCNKTLKDTLLVLITRGNIFAHTDTICEDTKHQMWASGRTWGEYIDTAKLEWRIIKGSGSLTPSAKGSKVCYIPVLADASVDTVKIEVKGPVLFSTATKCDTVCLKVNARPTTTIRDTLRIADRTVMLVSKIPDAEKIVSNAVSFEWKTAAGGVGTWSNPTDMTKAVYTWKRQFNEDYEGQETIYLEMKGLKGCTDTYRDTAIIHKSGCPEPTFKYSFDLCEGESIQLDDSYTIQTGNKRFMTLKWGTIPANVGEFTPDSKEYKWKTGTQATQLTLTVDKSIPFYDGTTVTLTSPRTVNNNIVTYSEPVITINGTKDTLCNTSNTITLAPGRIAVTNAKGTPGLKFDKSEKITATNYPTLESTIASGDVAKLIVYADQGRCTKWNDKTATLYIERLPKLNPTFSFATPTVCENGKVELTKIHFDGPVKDTVWTKSPAAAEVKKEGNQYFYYPKGYAIDGSVRLTPTPYKGCNDGESKRIDITILQLPFIGIKNRADTICILESESHKLNYTKHANVNQINWYAVKGGSTIDLSKVSGPSDASVVLTKLSNYSEEIPGRQERVVTIKAVITPKSPCSGTIEETMKIVLWPEPVVQASTGTHAVCQGGKFPLDFVTAGYASSYAWTIQSGNGSFENSNVLNTKYLPGENSGAQTLKITVRGEKGCKSISTNTSVDVEVNSINLPSFTVATAPVCENNQVSFTNTTAVLNGVTWSWQAESVEQSTSKDFAYTFGSEGSHTVKLTAKIGTCERSTEQQITVNSLPEPDFDATKNSTIVSGLGTGVEYKFVNKTPSANSFTWKFKDGNTWTTSTEQHSLHTFNIANDIAPGTEIRLVATNSVGCRDSISKYYIVVARPVPAFVVTKDTCTGAVSFAYTGTTSSDLVLDWDFGNGQKGNAKNVSTQYAISDYQDTTYTVTLTVYNAAASDGVTITDKIKIISNLKAHLAIVGGMECQSPIDVYLNSQLSIGRPDSCWVDWGDGVTWKKDTFPKKDLLHSYENDTEEEVKHFTIVVRVQNSCHDKTTSKVVDIFPNNVQASISVDKEEVCWGTTVTFTNLSKGFNHEEVQTLWDFGDGKDAEANHGPKTTVTHGFSMPGTYYVKLSAKDKCNHDVSNSIVMHILGDRSLTFNVSGNTCSSQDLTVAIPDSLLAPDRFYNYKWELGDGSYNYDGVSKLIHRYRLPREYQIKLTAIAVGAGNCSSEMIKKIDIKRTPKAAIGEWSETTGCAPLTIKLGGSGGLGADEMWWNFGDGNEEQRVEQVKHTYPKDGLYVVAFKIRSPEGCSDSTTISIRVKPTPEPSFDLLSDRLFCTPDGKVNFELRNTTPLMESSTYKWYYTGNSTLGEPFSMETQPATFNGIGIFGELALKLVATNKESGCVNTYTDSVVSSHSVEAELLLNVDSLHNACATNPITFTSVSRYGNQLAWNLGDGSFQLHDSTFVHSYYEPGEYSITLDVANTYGCTDNINRKITVYPLPIPEFLYEKDNRILPEDGVPSDLVANMPDIDNGGYLFTNESSVPYYSFAKDRSMSYVWDLSDTIFKGYQEKQLFHRFRNNGLYNVTLYATTVYGCLDSVSDAVRIGTVKGLFIPTAFAPSTPDEGINLFQPKGVGLASYKMQVFDMWGGCVWSTSKLENGHPAEAWDGLINGSPGAKGTYLWKATGVFLDGSIWNDSGGVVLIR